MADQNEKKGISQLTVRGISMQKLNLFMAVVTLVISAILLFAAYRTTQGYRTMRQAAESYITEQIQAFQLQVSSDYLTEQARCFAVTGDREYMDNYFEEANVTRRRDAALETLKEELSDTEAYRNLNAAMDKSLALMNREYYSMRLAAEAFGYDLSTLPREIQNVRLGGKTQQMTPEEKATLARSMVFDDEYHRQKQAISDSMQKCMDALVGKTDGELEDASEALRKLLKRVEVLIIILIAVVLAIVLLTFLLVISPLIRAVIHVRADQPLPVRGSYEFRFLARTYNLMYEANRESREQLAYEATHDQLTGLYNRSGFDFLRKNVDFNHAALLLFDLDKFKSINDTYGHETGDLVLARMAAVARENFRSGDYICRIGGDEFATIMVAAGRNNMELIRNKISAINEKLSRGEENLPPTSISVGVAFGAPGMDVQDIYRAADKALYSVKNNGGHGCAFYDESMAATDGVGVGTK